MAKYFLQQKYDINTKQYLKDEFEVQDNDAVGGKPANTIIGKFKFYTKTISEKAVNAQLSFIAFKKNIDEETIDALLNNQGSIEVTESQITLNAYEKKDKKTGEISIAKDFRMIINEARLPSDNRVSGKVASKTKSSKPKEEIVEEDDEIPF
jgi:hypothetical protein